MHALSKFRLPAFRLLLAATSALMLCSPALSEQSIRVHAVSAQLSDVEFSPSVTGIVAARVQSNVAFEVGGRVLERLVETGEHVNQGDVLARLDAPEQALQVASAQAALDAARAAAEESSQTLARQQRLFQSGVVSRSALDSAQQAARSDEADVQAAEAQLAAAREQQSYAELRAEADGIIVDYALEPGQVVAAGQTVFVIAEDGARDAVFSLYEAVLPAIDKQRLIDIWLIADPRITAKGRVREVSPIIDADTGVITVKVGIIDPLPEMTLGAAVGATAEVAEAPGYVIPKGALSAQDGAPAVWVVGEDDRVSLRPVDIERYTEDSLLIRDGLSNDDVVVTSGAQFMHPGQMVEIVDEADE